MARSAVAAVLTPVVTVLRLGTDNVVTGDWPDRVITEVGQAELHAYEVPEPRAKILVLAGGGYVQLMHDKEGVEVALWLNTLGYSAYVLDHGLPGQLGNPSDIALSDGLLALDHLGDDLPVFAFGLSSGGHLAGVLAANRQLAGALIAYAPVNANHRDYKAPAGKPDFPPPEKQQFYNDWPIGIAAERQGWPKCPVFLAYGLHDPVVPIEHALNFIKSARDAAFDLDAHIFNDAPHGFCLRETDGTHAVWPDLAADWMARKLA